MKEIPVYLFTGFMDSGKTSLIKESLITNDFAENGRSLILSCEDGEVAYEEEKLKKINASLVMIEKQEELTEDFLKEINLQYRPEQVFLEYNGTWGMDTILEITLPTGWVIVQSLATVDATTFDLYLANMRTMILEQLFAADVIIFNRCDDSTDKGKYRRNVKALNRKAQIVYERADGTIDNREEELPFDISGEELEITDADYGIWFIDCMENPKRYKGKKVKFLALVYNPDDLKKGIFVPGRFAMTCCEDDITFIGFQCKYPKEDEIPHKSWIYLTAEVRVEFSKEYRGKGPILYPVSITPAQKPKEELIYFS
ncbi:MAG: GTP-binding protein [Clostridiales bacterium]|nr:GTP-binding protein [Clostridiales bacterium]